MESIRQAWAKSKTFRIILISALIWFILRAAFQFIYSAGLFPEITGQTDLPGDLPVYMGAAQKFELRQTLYPQDLSNSTYHYPYPPPFAMASTALLWLPERWTAVILFVMIMLAYVLIYFLWIKIFQHLKLARAVEQMAWTLPVWLIFSTFWAEVGYLNVATLVTLAVTLLIKSILEERLGWSVFWLTLLLYSKVMWVFPIALPLLLGNRRFFFKLLALGVASYLAVIGLTMLAAGPAYTIQQYGEYFHHLGRMTNEFPWHILAATPYIGYNHSIKQIFIFVLGNQPWVQLFATLVKVAILVPLAVLAWRLIRHPLRGASAEKTSISLFLDLAFVLFLGTFIWLDIVWGASLEIVVFVYLLATLEQRWEKGLVWGLFFIYAILDVVRLISYLVGGDSVYIADGQYLLTDINVYIPLIMIVILVFYTFLIKRLLQAGSNATVVKA